MELITLEILLLMTYITNGLIQKEVLNLQQLIPITTYIVDMLRRVLEVHIDSLRRSDVKRFYNSLIDDYGYDVRTVDSIHTVLHQVLDFGVDDEYLRYNPSDNAMKELKRTHDKSNVKKYALTIQEQLAFENFLDIQTRFKDLDQSL